MRRGTSWLIKITAAVFIIIFFNLAFGQDQNIPPQAGNDGKWATPSGRNIGEFLTPDGKFDLETARRSGYEGALDVGGFQSVIDPVTGQPIFQPTDSKEPASHADDIYWDNSISPAIAGAGGPILAATIYNGQLVVGGNFLAAGGVKANYIAAWDGISWSPLGSGVPIYSDPVVYCLTVYDGNLIAGSGGVVASWNGINWTTLMQLINGGRICALTVYNGSLWAGGQIIVGWGTYYGLRRWDGSNWHNMAQIGSGGAWIYAMTEYDGKLIVGGEFTMLDGVTAKKIASWDGSSWSALGSGMDSNVFALTVYDGKLIAGGSFTTAGGVAANRIASWNGSSWSSLGSGIGGSNPYVYALAVYDNELITGGYFTSAGGSAANYIASWDGSSWSTLGSGTSSTVSSLAVYDTKLIAGGMFARAGGGPGRHIASWNGSNWSPLGSGINSYIYALTLYNGNLIAGGYFSIIGGVEAFRIASWDGSNWSPLGSGMNDGVNVLTIYDGKLIAGGYFTTAGGVTANRIASWNGSNWSALGTGMIESDARIWSLTVYDNELIAGGGFSTAGGVSANCIASWDGSNWSALGSGMNNSVWCMTEYNGNLISAGSFTTAGGSSIEYIASWDGSSWSSLGSGMDSAVAAVTIYDGKLIAGGYFTSAGGVSASRIASWNGSSWSPLGSGIGSYNSRVLCLAVYNLNLIAGGTIVTAGGVSASKIASWNGTGWAPLGSGLEGYDAYPRALAVYRKSLVSGGIFTIAGAKVAAFMAEWNDYYGKVTTLADSGPGTLRAAIAGANGFMGPDTVTFAVFGTISLTTQLPAIIDDSIIILGSTAPGGAHSVILDGSGLSSSNGLVIQSSNNKIEGLTIRSFPGCGIEVSGALSTYNTIINNLIYKNAGLAIDLNNDGVTANDVGDVDTGPNDLFNYPAIDSVRMQTDSTFLIYGSAADSAIIEFFTAHPAGDATKPADPLGHGEAYSYAGSDTSAVGGAFIFTSPKTIRQFSMLSTTATDTLGNTSEFGQNFTLTPSPLIIVAYSPVNLTVTDPNGFYIGKDSLGNLGQTLFPATYNETPNDSINIPHPILGQYQIAVVRQQGAPPGATYSVGVRIDGTEQCMLIVNAMVPSYGATSSFDYGVEEDWHYKNGDANDNGTINIQDITFLINYLYKGGPPPMPVGAGDSNCSGIVNIQDITYLINFLYKGGPVPCRIN